MKLLLIKLISFFKKYQIFSYIRKLLKSKSLAFYLWKIITASIKDRDYLSSKKLVYTHIFWITWLETVLPKCCQRWRRRIRGLVYRTTWKYSPLHRQKAPRSLVKPADVRISRRDSTVIQRAVRLKSKIFQCQRQNRNPWCCRYQSPFRSRWH